MKTEKYDSIILSSNSEKIVFDEFVGTFKENPLPNDEIMANLGLFLSSKSLSRILFFYEIYKKILHNHGIIIEFGVRWGQTLSIMSALRGIFEPFNRHRKIVGFDTFEGLKGVNEKDGDLSKCVDGSFSVPYNYDQYLDKILSLQEKMNPMSHIKRYEIIKGDVLDTLPVYLEKHPETIISLVIFDFDIYIPTKVSLEMIKSHMCKGSILIFDELCDEMFPGETVALKEIFNLNDMRIKRLPMTARVSYIEIE